MDRSLPLDCTHMTSIDTYVHRHRDWSKQTWKNKWEEIVVKVAMLQTVACLQERSAPPKEKKDPARIIDNESEELHIQIAPPIFFMDISH